MLGTQGLGAVKRLNLRARIDGDRNSIAVNGCVTLAEGRAEPEAASRMLRLICAADLVQRKGAGIVVPIWPASALWLPPAGRKTRHRGLAKVGWMFAFALAAYNLVRMRNLAAA